MSVGCTVNPHTIWNTHADFDTASTHTNMCDWYYHVETGRQLDDKTQTVFQCAAPCFEHDIVFHYRIFICSPENVGRVR